jgi:hypothetical protein
MVEGWYNTPSILFWIRGSEGDFVSIIGRAALRAFRKTGFKDAVPAELANLMHRNINQGQLSYQINPIQQAYKANRNKELHLMWEVANTGYCRKRPKMLRARERESME